MYELKNVINDECHSSNGYLCLFPYFYQGKSYNACTLLNYHKYWCGTSYDSNGEDFNWGICNTNCPIGGGFFCFLVLIHKLYIINQIEYYFRTAR